MFIIYDKMSHQLNSQRKGAKRRKVCIGYIYIHYMATITQILSYKVVNLLSLNILGTWWILLVALAVEVKTIPVLRAGIQLLVSSLVRHTWLKWLHYLLYCIWFRCAGPRTRLKDAGYQLLGTGMVCPWAASM